MKNNDNRKYLLRATGLALFLFIVLSCNNPFSTRTPQKPDPFSGKAIKPANSPENVLYNLSASFESLSIQDYLDIFSEDFIFNPDSDDSLRYEEEFRYGWGFEEETVFAENFLQKTVTSEIEVYPTYDYDAGEDKYNYIYSMKIFPPDSTEVVPMNVKGHAWIYLSENKDGKWMIYKWVEIANMLDEEAFITWGVLRARYR